MDTSICCVCAHLSAGQNKQNGRAKDFADITSTRFRRMYRTPTIDSHDYVFWFGDLNARIELDPEVTLRMIEKNDIAKLLLYDQVSRPYNL